jgi:hypothetical protein
MQSYFIQHSGASEFRDTLGKQLISLTSLNYKIIDVKYSTNEKFYTALILYEDKPINKNKISKEIKDFIVQTIHDELKDIREIYNDFHNLAKDIKKD